MDRVRVIVRDMDIDMGVKFDIKIFTEIIMSLFPFQ